MGFKNSGWTRGLNGLGMALCAALFVAMGMSAKEESFKSQIGNVAVGAVRGGGAISVPFITWGGDIATFYANGGLKTAPGSLFQKQGLNIELKAGDNFDQQVKDYISGKSPFLRGTFSMIGMASEVIGEDPRTRGVVFLQLTWSAGDHMVVRNTIKTANDLRGKSILLQKGGPHVGMLNDILRSARIGWDEVNVVWTKDLTGSPDSPSEKFRKDAKYDACFAISPDMASLCGGLDKTGTGAEGTVKGSRVLVSTAQLSHSIADVYVCRRDYYDANKEQITRFVAGYLKGCEEVLELKKKYDEKDARGASEYTKLMELAQDIYTKQVVPTVDDADGMISDAVFVLHPGNKEFFTNGRALTGFDTFNTQALDLAAQRGYANRRFDLMASGLDYDSATFKNYLTKMESTRAEFDQAALSKSIKEMDEGALADGTILSFSINFRPNQFDFPVEKYKDDFTHVAETAAKFGNAAVVVRGHTDTALLLKNVVDAGMKKGILERVGTPGNFKYKLNGQPFDLEKPLDVIKAIESGAFDGLSGEDGSPKDILQSIQTLSQQRADRVRDTVVSFAVKSSWLVDPKQIQPIGVGIREPIVPKPRSEEDAAKNMRVEFRLVKIPAEFRKKSDFNF